MGCGSSIPDVNDARVPTEKAEAEEVAERKRVKAKLVDSKCNSALDTYLSAILRIEPGSADVARYVLALRSVGCDSPGDLGEITVDELACEPFNFKRLHLTKVRSLAVGLRNHQRVHVCARAYFFSFFVERVCVRGCVRGHIFHTLLLWMLPGGAITRKSEARAAAGRFASILGSLSG